MAGKPQGQCQKLALHVELRSRSVGQSCLDSKMAVVSTSCHFRTAQACGRRTSWDSAKNWHFTWSYAPGP